MALCHRHRLADEAVMTVARLVVPLVLVFWPHRDATLVRSAVLLWFALSPVCVVHTVGIESGIWGPFRHHFPLPLVLFPAARQKKYLLLSHLVRCPAVQRATPLLPFLLHADRMNTASNKQIVITHRLGRSPELLYKPMR